MYSITLKQRTDGQIRVSSIWVPTQDRLENPYLKEEMRKDMENMLKDKHIKVLEDIGYVDFD